LKEIADRTGWHCLVEAPKHKVQDLCRRWPNIDPTELFEFKQKYEPPPAAVGGRRVAGAA
jgi:hypothetical protein